MAKYLFKSGEFLIAYLGRYNYTIDEFCEEFEIEKDWLIKLLNSDYLQKEKQYVDFAKKISVPFKRFFLKIG